MSMSNGFRQALDRFVEERTLDIGNHLINKHQEYIQLINEKINVQKKIECLLPEEYKSLAEEYERIETLLQGLAMDFAYIEGFKDGIQF